MSGHLRDADDGGGSEIADGARHGEAAGVASHGTDLFAALAHAPQARAGVREANRLERVVGVVIARQAGEGRGGVVVRGGGGSLFIAAFLDEERAAVARVRGDDVEVGSGWAATEMEEHDARRGSAPGGAAGPREARAARPAALEGSLDRLERGDTRRLEERLGLVRAALEERGEHATLGVRGRGGVDVAVEHRETRQEVAGGLRAAALARGGGRRSTHVGLSDEFVLALERRRLHGKHRGAAAGDPAAHSQTTAHGRHIDRDRPARDRPARRRVRRPTEGDREPDAESAVFGYYTREFGCPGCRLLYDLFAMVDDVVAAR